MDDENIYGKEIYRISFGRAVDEGLLSDYKVIVLTVNENVITKTLKDKISSDIEKEIDNNDIAKLIGCINALSKNLPHEEDLVKIIDPGLMKTAIAFSKNIKVSKQVEKLFTGLQKSYYSQLNQEEREKLVITEAQHIDGIMSAITREEKLSWLKRESGNSHVCKILTNVRCLSEGVDVPSLDAAIFLSDKNSQIEIVQSVGRIMRKAPNKKYGYIIIPVVIPYDENPEEYLDKGNKFKQVWNILNALRSHDDRFEAKVNTLTLKDKNDSKNLNNISVIVDNISNQDKGIEDSNSTIKEEINSKQLELDFGEYKNKIYATIVKKVGDKKYFEAWASEVADIAKANINRINDIINKNITAKEEFYKFLNNIHNEINPYVTEQDAIEMLSQHLITQPIFEVLFDGYDFVKNNPISKSMSKIIDLLEKETPEEDIEKLKKFYSSIQTKIKQVKTTEERQKVIKDLYENFFQIAFKQTSDKLGIVYTPIEIVDFIIYSVSDILEKEFNKKITNENINIIDPFTGTGTFITRLLQSGLIKPEDLKRKYNKELFANEIVLLAYYIASVNIENIYHSLLPENSDYETFNGMCLTDTFQLYEDMMLEKENEVTFLKDDKANKQVIKENSERIKKQKESPITIVISNPPYSVGQKSANDNNQNQHYLKLEKKIAETYVKNSTAQKSKMYDSYIKAFRWASDRLDKNTGGIIGFITNSGWLDASSADGFRYCLENEFSSIYIFDLKGAIRGKSGELAKKEGQNVFNIMAGVAITILVKKPNNTQKAKIYYYSIGNYLKRKDKLKIIKDYKSILNKNIQWQEITPNEHNDWLNQRSTLFDTLIAIEPEKKYDINSQSFFINYSCGIVTARDNWVYNFSKNQLEKNINTTINYYNQQRNEVVHNKNELIRDKTKGNWSRDWDNYLKKNIEIKEDKNLYYISLYRPFCKQNVYFADELNQERYQMPSIFPNNKSENLCICIPSINNRKKFFCLLTKNITDLGLNTDGTQCFPLYYYEKVENQQLILFDKNEEEYERKDAISDFILERAKDNYGPNVTKEDIFYYVYGILHSPIYREKFQIDLKKMLPRIPLIAEPKDFWKFSKAGRELAELHLNYEDIPANEDCEVIGRESNNFIVEKMQFGKNNNKEKDITTIIYNHDIQIKNIPEKAYDYIINGKSAIEWIIDRYQIKIDKESGITNNPNDWAIEQNKPSYILDLLLSVIELSIKTLDIIENLPELKFDE